jgi:hypothetical protein
VAFATLRPGNVHSAEGWPKVLEAVIARYGERGFELYFRGDAGFVKPEIYQRLEAEGERCAETTSGTKAAWMGRQAGVQWLSPAGLRSQIRVRID